MYLIDVSFKIVMSSLLCAYLPDAIFLIVYTMLTDTIKLELEEY